MSNMLRKPPALPALQHWPLSYQHLIMETYVRFLAGQDFGWIVPVLTSKYDAVLKSICSTAGQLLVSNQTRTALSWT
jgi:hypothetical protein